MIEINHVWHLAGSMGRYNRSGKSGNTFTAQSSGGSHVPAENTALFGNHGNGFAVFLWACIRRRDPSNPSAAARGTQLCAALLIWSTPTSGQKAPARQVVDPGHQPEA